MSAGSPSGLERSVLENKDRDQLMTIAAALGVKANARATKATLIGKILEQTGAGQSAPSVQVAPPAASEGDAASAARPRARAPRKVVNGDEPSAAQEDAVEAVVTAPAVADSPVAEAAVEVLLGPDGEPLADWEADLVRSGQLDPAALASPPAERVERSSSGQDRGNGSRPSQAIVRPDASRADSGRAGAARPDVARQEAPRPGSGRPDAARNDQPRSESARPDASRIDAPRPDTADPSADGGVEREGSRRRRRRNRNRNGREDGVAGIGYDGPGAPAQLGSSSSATSADDPIAAAYGNEPVAVAGFLDLRDEGYGFLRVNGYLPSRDDAYISVKQTKQYGLRKGDHLTGFVRPATRQEKNPALLSISTVNDGDPELLRNRPRFEDLTPLFPDKKLKLEHASDATNMTARIVDLVSPIGKGQRGLIVSPPKAGKTTIMKTIATSIERNNPEVKLIVLLIDERPEEVTDMRRTVKGEVLASTFDRPSEEHTQLAEMCIERAKRLVEGGADVVIILDGITRLSRAYNLAAPATGRVMSGGIDAGALYPPKKFFGAARNIEEGGSLTILATALVETNSRMDDAIFEEFKGTGNMELRLDRKVAERRVFPAIDVDASSTRHEELLFDRRQLQQVWKLRRVLSGLAEGGSGTAGLELLIDRLKTFRTNDEFLAEIAKQPGV